MRFLVSAVGRPSAVAVFLIAVVASVDCGHLLGPEPQTDIEPALVKSAWVDPDNETDWSRQELDQMETMLKERNLLRSYIECPLPSIKVGDMCLWFSDIKLNWTDAQVYCKKMDFVLAVLETWRNGIDLQSYFLRNYKCEKFWLGANDMDAEGKWKWVTGALVSEDNIPWVCDQPDDWEGNEDCLEIGFYSGYNDQTCSVENRFVCEAVSWRSDYRCANGRYDYKAPNGGPAECNAFGHVPCCSNYGWCGTSPRWCDCPTCIDYRDYYTG